MLLLPFCSFSFSEKSPPWLPAQLRGKHTNLNVELGGDSIPLRPSGGRKKPQLLFVLFFGTSSEVVQQYNRSQGGCGSNWRGAKAGAHRTKCAKTEIPNSCDEFLGLFVLFFFLIFFSSNGRFYGRATWGVSMSKFHYIALKNLFDFGLPFLLSSLAILSPGRVKTRQSSLLYVSR